MNILMISPNSPPKNSAESMQVGRYLKELDKEQSITLVTTPIERGWIVEDNSLSISLSNTSIINLSLPFHYFFVRLFSSKYFRWLAIPDKDFWIQYKSSYVKKQLKSQPDIIYSRSLPFSSCLLALRLKKKLSIPWVMHLSDPLIDNPYRRKSSREKELKAYELMCFKEASYITLTTEKMMYFYVTKYPQYADKIKVIPNVMPYVDIKNQLDSISNEKITMIYAGALYGDRNFDTFLAALKILSSSNKELLNKIKIKIIGNIDVMIEKKINTSHFSCIEILGRLDYHDVLKIQEESDILISIEPDGSNPILKTFMPSKILDYLALGKPILALTPKGSETWDICNKHGFGWAVESNSVKKLYTLMIEILDGTKTVNRLIPNYKIFESYHIEKCVHDLDVLFQNTIDRKKV